jgi:hypothetical protein
MRALPLVSVLILLCARTQAELYVFQAAADTAIIEHYPQNNMGKSTRLPIGTELGGRCRALMRFDLSNLPATTQVAFATLRIATFFPTPTKEEAPTGSRSPTGFAIFRELRAWEEGEAGGKWGAQEPGKGATWLFPEIEGDSWLEPGGKYAEEFYYLASADHTPNYAIGGIELVSGALILSDVRDWMQDPASNRGWLFYSRGEQNRACCLNGEDFWPYSMMTIASREDSQVPPQLLIYTGNPNAPRVFVNGEFVQTEAFVDTQGKLTLESPYTNGRVFYTLDGGEPNLGSTRYDDKVVTYVYPGQIIRAVTYSADYSEGGATVGPLPVRTASFFGLTFRTSGSGVVWNNGLPRGSAATLNVTSNKVVNLVAAPQPGWHFVNWTGDYPSGETNIFVLVDRPKTVQANFALDGPGPQLTVKRVQTEWVVVQFEAQPNFIYTVQESTNLRDWNTVQEQNNQSGLVDTILPFNKGTGGRFYRVVGR